MLQENIEKFNCKVGIVRRHEGDVHIHLKNENPLYGSLPAQIFENLKNNFWDFGLPDRPLVSGEDITAIVWWDRAKTRKFSDEFPEGILTGSSKTFRSARPSTY
jgi:hypothetical protein